MVDILNITKWEDAIATYAEPANLQNLGTKPGPPRELESTEMKPFKPFLEILESRNLPAFTSGVWESGRYCEPPQIVQTDTASFNFVQPVFTPNYVSYSAQASASVIAPFPNSHIESSSGPATEYFLSLVGPGTVTISGYSEYEAKNNSEFFSYNYSGFGWNSYAQNYVFASAGGGADFYPYPWGSEVVGVGWESDVQEALGESSSGSNSGGQTFHFPSYGWIEIPDYTGVHVEVIGGSASASASGGWTATFVPDSPPDITATQLAWQPSQANSPGGVNFGYAITGADLPQSTTAALYWSPAATFDASADTLAYQTPIQSQVGTYGPIFVSGADLTTAPSGTKYLLSVLDPDNLVSESDETNNVQALAVPETPPHTTDSLTGTLGSNSWYTSSVTVTLLASDAGAGVASTQCSLDRGATWFTYAGPFTVSAQGTTALEFYSVDKVGNQETIEWDTFNIDSVSPQTVDSLTGTLGNNGWYKSNVRISLSSSDATSGVAKTTYSLDQGQTWKLYTIPFVVRAQGTTTVEYYSTDYAGNKESIEWQNVGIDNVKPQTTLQVTGAELNNGWWTSATVVSFSATDASSGVSGIFYSLNKGKTWIQYTGPLYIDAQGKTPVKFYSVDNAGNQEKAQSYSLQIDMLAPHTTDSLAGTLGSNGWYTSSVTISLSATDANSSVANTPGVANTSGVANTFYSLDGGKTWILYKAPFVVKTQGTTTLKYYSVDKAGNQESTKSDSFNIDTAAPHTTESLAGTLSSNGWYTSSVTVTLSGSDVISGVASIFYSLDSGSTWITYTAPFVISAQGTTKVEYYSVDVAGNREKTKSDTFKIVSLSSKTAVVSRPLVGSQDATAFDPTAKVYY